MLDEEEDDSAVWPTATTYRPSSTMDTTRGIIDRLNETNTALNQHADVLTDVRDELDAVWRWLRYAFYGLIFLAVCWIVTVGWILVR